MHIGQYNIKGGILPSMHFHDLFEVKVPQQATDIQAIKIASYQDSTRVRFKCSRIDLSFDFGGW